MGTRLKPLTDDLPKPMIPIMNKPLLERSIPTLIVHGDDDQIVPIGAAALISSKLIKNVTLKIYAGAPQGLMCTHQDQLNTDLLAFLVT